ncbi:MAG: glycosyltransferase family 2 protein, partial [Anaerolineales bacterium]|nr:glycosyltransferase family 2 protein [Anaerolineales bacterium]
GDWLAGWKSFQPKQASNGKVWRLVKMIRRDRLTLEKIVSETPPVLSIVIGAYNHESYVSECLESILDCRRIDNIEIIVIDDGSSDNTLAVVEKTLSTAHANYRVYTKPNKGLTDSLLIGLELVTGKFVAFMASDDVYAPEGLAFCLDKLESLDDPDLALLFQGEFFGSLTGPVYNEKTKKMFQLSPKNRVKALSIEYPRPLLLQTTDVGTNFLKKVAPGEDRLFLDDWPTFLKVARTVASGYGSFLYDPSIVLSHYRVHNAGIHANSDRMLAACLEVAEKVVDASLRSECRSNILLDVALVHLYSRRFSKFMPLFLQGIREYPRASTLVRIPKRVVKSVLKRIRSFTLFSQKQNHGAQDGTAGQSDA